MTALPQPFRFEQAPSTIDWSQFVTVAEAAKLMGKNAGSLRLKCQNVWGPKAQAMQAKPESSGKPGGQYQWFIHRSVDAALSTEPKTGLIGTDAEVFETKSASHRAMAIKRGQCVTRYRQAKSQKLGNQKEWIGPFLAELKNDFPNFKISKTSLDRWNDDAGSPINLVMLVDRRGGDQRSTGDPQAWDYFRDIYCDDRQPSLAACHKRTAEYAKSNNIAWCSIKSCQRQRDDRITKEQQAYYRDPAKWRSKYATNIAQDIERFGANDCWVSDHRPLDLICYYQGKLVRPMLTIWQDWRTRKIVGRELSVNPNADVILAALAGGIEAGDSFGPPKIAWLDNGKDFDCYMMTGMTKKQRQKIKKDKNNKLKLGDLIDETAFAGIFGLLGIEPHFSIPYGPQGKARCERFFATVGVQFDKTFATYCGKDTTRKPETLAKIVKTKKHAIPEFQHVKKRLFDFIDGYNINADHNMIDLVDEQGKKISPAQAFAIWSTPRVLANPAALAHCLKHWEQSRTVGRNGVRVTIGGVARYYGQYNHDLKRFKGTKEKVIINYDPNDTRSVHIYDQKMRLITYADLNPTGGVHDTPEHAEHVKKVQKQKATYNKSLIFVRQHQELEYLSTNELIAQEAADSPKDNPVPDRPQPVGPINISEVVQTPFDDQLNDLQTQENKLAAGAENQTHDDIDIGDLLGGDFNYNATETEVDPIGSIGFLDNESPMVGDLDVNDTNDMDVDLDLLDTAIVPIVPIVPQNQEVHNVDNEDNSVLEQL